MVSMNDSLRQSFGAELSQLSKDLQSCAIWPSPSTGLAIHLLELSDCESTKRDGVQMSAAVGPLDTAPSIASAGYAMRLLKTSSSYTGQWQIAVNRLMKQEPFPRDRQTFAYRPAELIGIGLGICTISADLTELNAWFRNVIKDLPSKTPPTAAWACLLYHYAASLVGMTWPIPVSIPLSELDLSELSLLIILLRYGRIKAISEFDDRKAQIDLLQRTAVQRPDLRAPEKLAAVFAGLTLSVHARLSTLNDSSGISESQVRQLSSTVSIVKKQILFLSANPKSSTQLALDEECRQIQQKIRATQHRDSLELITGWAVQPEDLLQYLNQHRPHVVHFSGHGTRADEIVLLDKNGDPKRVSAGAIKQLFKTLKDNIRIVVLNACYSRPQAESIIEVIDCAIGMNRAIGDAAAIVFAAAFYQALGFGRSVETAFESGKTALMLEGIAEDHTPELLCRRGVDPTTVYLIEPPLH